MANLLTIMDDLLEDLRPVSNNAFNSLGYTATAPINVLETADRFEINISIPGIDPKEIKLEVVENVLNISYKNQQQQDENSKDKYIRREYRAYNFSRSIQFPKNIDVNSIKAKSKHGILDITVDKMPESKPKSIDINIDSE